MKKFLLVISVALMCSGLQSQKVLVGWHTFTATSAPIANEVPDNAESGFSGILGGEVNPAYSTTGGGNGVGTGNSGDNTYGQSVVINPLPTVSNSCVKMSPTNNAKRRVDFQVTNNSGASVTLGGIHFDYAYVWGADVDNLKLSVKHFGAMSDLSNANTILVENIGFANSDDKAWHSIDVSLANMGNDITLADGQKAAFWIELPGSGVNGDANVIIDNIAITDNSNATPTSIHSSTLSSKVRIYPNPATEVINIEAVEAEITEVQLLDLTGKVVYKSNTTDAINVSSLSKGFYVVKMEAADGEVCTNKILIK
ncbi:T9SS type A sorting domain-containing protein [Carboxylicivirga marina]|uniref:T9SS type A sorting domain-containing protein n=1 Tax=Carboxylicivirga marina TaxID=2800988 RepID=A0ABS1HF99_9BACT|nr:T9SS type A sorting domain-containing protein [Carboxylicivirga marina]MBK3516150.1 T9SS type A sorting domain-containing protein [Carboxylicivirga marina]